MKKIFRVIGICFIVLVAAFAFVGCGESAYQLAVRNGYTGTESQWLESLKGKNGQNGENGISYQDIRDLYDDLIDNGEYSGSFLDFIKDYIKVYDVGRMDLVANHALLSTVSVRATYGMYGAAGSGVIYEIDEANQDVYIVTNYHVVYMETPKTIANNITINLYGKESTNDAISCEYLGGSEAYDVAVLKTSSVGAQTIINNHYEAVEIEEYNNLTPGQTMLAVGNAEGEGITVVSGIVSVESRYIAYYISKNLAYYHRVLQFDAQINSGNSGGGLYNSDGKMIGIVCARHISTVEFSSVEVVEGMCYGVPVVNIDCIYKYVRATVSNPNKTIKSYDFGMEYAGENSYAYYDTTEHRTKIVEDVAITSVTAGGLAEKVGLASEDLIKKIKVTKVGGEEIEMDITRDFMVNDILLFANAVGDEIEITVSRDSVQMVLTYTMIEADSDQLKTLESMATTV